MSTLEANFEIRNSPLYDGRNSPLKHVIEKVTRIMLPGWKRTAVDIYSIHSKQIFLSLFDGNSLIAISTLLAKLRYLLK